MKDGVNAQINQAVASGYLRGDELRSVEENLFHNDEVKILIIPKDTTIKINGIPFTLKEDIEVYGLLCNLELAFNSDKKPSFNLS